jgi:hypothetical protein
LSCRWPGVQAGNQGADEADVGAGPVDAAELAVGVLPGACVAGGGVLDDGLGLADGVGLDDGLGLGEELGLGEADGLGDWVELCDALGLGDGPVVAVVGEVVVVGEWAGPGDTDPADGPGVARKGSGRLPKPGLMLGRGWPFLAATGALVAVWRKGLAGF